MSSTRERADRHADYLNRLDASDRDTPFLQNLAWFFRLRPSVVGSRDVRCLRSFGGGVTVDELLAECEGDEDSDFYLTVQYKHYEGDKFKFFLTVPADVPDLSAALNEALGIERDTPIVSDQNKQVSPSTNPPSLAGDDKSASEGSGLEPATTVPVGLYVMSTEVFSGPLRQANVVAPIHFGFDYGEGDVVEQLAPLSLEIGTNTDDTVSGEEDQDVIEVPKLKKVVDEFGPAHSRAEQTRRRIRVNRVGPMIRAVVRELQTELPVKVTPYSRENYTVVFGKAKTILKARHGLRDVDVSKLLPLITELYFVPTLSQISADDFARSYEVRRRRDEARASMVDSAWLGWWPFSMFSRNASTPSFVT